VANVPGFLPSDTLLQPNLFDQSNQTKCNQPADARTKRRKYPSKASISTPRKSIRSMMHINPTYWRHAGTAISFQLEMNFYNRSTNRKEIAYVDYHQKHGNANSIIVVGAGAVGGYPSILDPLTYTCQSHWSPGRRTVSGLLSGRCWTTASGRLSSSDSDWRAATRKLLK
jgi:hypothetical protein